jgi:hypothetical protein
VFCFKRQWDVVSCSAIHPQHNTRSAAGSLFVPAWQMNVPFLLALVVFGVHFLARHGDVLFIARGRRDGVHFLACGRRDVVAFPRGTRTVIFGRVLASQYSRPNIWHRLRW